MEMSDSEESVGSKSNFSSLSSHTSLSDTKASFTEPPVKKRKLQKKMERCNFDIYNNVSNPPYAEEVDLNNETTQLVLRAAAQYAEKYPRNLSEETFGRADCRILHRCIKDRHNGVDILSVQQVWHRLMYAYHCFKSYCLLMKNGQDEVLFDYATGHVSPMSPATNFPAVHCGLQHQAVITNFSLLKKLFFFTWSKISNCVEVPAPAAQKRKRSCSTLVDRITDPGSATEEIPETL